MGLLRNITTPLLNRGPPVTGLRLGSARLRTALHRPNRNRLGSAATAISHGLPVEVGRVPDVRRDRGRSVPRLAPRLPIARRLNLIELYPAPVTRDQRRPDQRTPDLPIRVPPAGHPHAPPTCQPLAPRTGRRRALQIVQSRPLVHLTHLAVELVLASQTLPRGSQLLARPIFLPGPHAPQTLLPLHLPHLPAPPTPPVVEPVPATPPRRA